jgi:PleD family two-component response regulator
VAVEAKLIDLCQRELVFEADQTMAMERAEQQLPTFTKASQNMAMVTTLLDTLPAPSTNEVGEMYQQLKSILGTATAQQVESSLQHQV